MLEDKMKTYQEGNVPYQLSKVKLLITKVFGRALKKEGVELTPEQLHVLGFLSANKKGCCMNEIACELLVDNSAITRLVDTLEGKKFVKRIILKEDRRQRFIEITSKGEEELCKTMELTKEYRENITRGFSAQEKSDFLKMLTIIHENAEQALLDLEK